MEFTYAFFILYSSNFLNRNLKKIVRIYLTFLSLKIEKKNEFKIYCALKYFIKKNFKRR